jgi:ubiquinone/menaquinone biosynthesis C-methylase UbiE
MNSNASAESTSVERPCLKTCKQGGWREQFGRPSGLLGRAVGRLMAAKNHYMNQLAVEVLNVQPDDQVLEIGFGPGRAIEMVAAGMTNGFVSGVDHSEVMLRQAAKRNRKLIEAGRVELRQASVSRLPYADARSTQELLHRVGFRNIRTQVRQLKREVTCVLANR